MNINPILISKKSVYFVVFTTLLVLLLPLIAMQFTNQVNWQLNDFVVAGVILCFFGYLYKVLTKTSHNPIKNIAMGMLVLGLFAFVWLSLI